MKPEWDNQFAETEYERNARLRAKRLQKAKDPRDPVHSKHGIFVYHSCSRCGDGARQCVNGNPNQCEYPHARND